MHSGSSVLRLPNGSEDGARRTDFPSPSSHRSSFELATTTETSSMLPLAASESQSRHRWKMLGKIGYVPGWEGLRGYAVSLVMYSHVMQGKEMVGILGVGCFFVLSGFLITGVLMSQIENKDKAHQDSNPTKPSKGLLQRYSFLPGFYMDRFVRLTPALAMMVGTIWYVGYIQGREKAPLRIDALSAFFYIHNFYPPAPDGSGNLYPGLFIHTWSLAVEEQFYIFWSLLIPFVAPLPLKKRAVLLGVLISISYWLRYISAITFLEQRFLGLDYRYAFSVNAFKMLIGCAARLLPVPQVWTHKWVGTVSTLGLFLMTYLWGWGLPLINFDLRISGTWLEFLTSVLVLLVVVGSINGNPILESKLFRFTGRISYSWYLWQFPLHAYYDWKFSNWTATGLAFMVSTFTTFIVEEPIRNKYHAWKKSKSSAKGEEEKQHARRED